LSLQGKKHFIGSRDPRPVFGPNLVRSQQTRSFIQIQKATLKSATLFKIPKAHKGFIPMRFNIFETSLLLALQIAIVFSRPILASDPPRAPSASARIAALGELRALYSQHFSPEDQERACALMLQAFGPTPSDAPIARWKVVLTPNDLNYLRLRSQGIPDSDIAKTLSFRLETIYQRRARICARLRNAGEDVGKDLDGWLLRQLYNGGCTH
jgi:DNA-binding CsgD family transcriptional regulator